MYEYEYGINLRHCNASLRYYKFFSLSVFFIILVQSHLASLFTEENNLEKFYSALSWTALITSFWKVNSNFLYKIIFFNLLEYAHMHYVMFFDIITDKTYVKILQSQLVSAIRDSGQMILRCPGQHGVILGEPVLQVFSRSQRFL